MPRSCPRRHARHLVAALAVAGVAACDHSDAFTTPATGTDQPRVPGAIAQLTYNQRPDRAPVASPDGGAIVYAFETGAADRDICLAALPSGGGTRLGEWCATDTGEATRADFFAAGALAADGRLAYTQHSSLVFAPIPSTGALYVAPAGDAGRRIKVLDLLRTYPGLTGPLDFLLDPVWTGADELLGLATTAQIARACNSCPWDTTYVGQAIVRIVPSAPNTVQALAAAPGVTQAAFDPSLRRFALRRDGEILVVPAAGGTPTLAYDAGADPAVPPRTVLGVAAGGGRLFVTRSWVAGGTSLSDIARLDGSTAVPVAGTESTTGVWRRATASADGRRLVVERLNRSTGDIDLYLVEVAP